VTLASIFTTNVQFSGTEHTRQNATIIVSSAVARIIINNMSISTVKLGWVVGSWVCDISPPADSNFGAVWHPFGRLGRWKLSWFNSVAQNHNIGKSNDGNIICDNQWSVVWMFHEFGQSISLLFGLVLVDVVRAGHCIHGFSWIDAMRCANTISSRNQSCSTKMRMNSLKGQNVRLAVRRNDFTSNDFDITGLGTEQTRRK